MGNATSWGIEKCQRWSLIPSILKNRRWSQPRARKEGSLLMSGAGCATPSRRGLLIGKSTWPRRPRGSSIEFYSSIELPLGLLGQVDSPTNKHLLELHNEKKSQTYCQRSTQASTLFWWVIPRKLFEAVVVCGFWSILYWMFTIAVLIVGDTMEAIDQLGY